MIPISLYLENFISHSRSFIDFMQFNSALIVGAQSNDPDTSNGVGKSSIFSAICWCLYGKSKFSTKDKVVKRGASKCCVKYQFKIEDIEWKVKRELDLRSGLTDVVLAKKEGDDWVSKPYIGDTNTITNKNIIDIIGISYEAFINVVYFRQNDISGFADATTKDRKNILKEILQIGIWDEFQKDARVLEKKNEARQDNLSSRIESLGDIHKEKSKAAAELKNLKEQMFSASNLVSTLEEKIRECNEEISTLELQLSSLGHTNRKRLEEKAQFIAIKVDENRARRAVLSKRVKENNNIITNASNEIMLLEQKIVESAKKILLVDSGDRKEAANLLMTITKGSPNLSVEIPAIQYSKRALQEKVEEQKLKHRNLDLLNMKLNQLTSLRPGKECPICLTELDEASVSERRNSKEDALRAEIAKEQQHLVKLSAAIQQNEAAMEAASEASVNIQRLGLIISKHKTSINEAVRYNEDIQNEVVRLKEDWDRLKSNREKINNTLLESKNTTHTQNKLESIYKSRQNLIEKVEEARTKCIEISVKCGNREGYLEDLNRRLSEKAVLEEQLKNIAVEIDACSSLVRIFGKDGIQAIIMENVTEDLESYTNLILRDISSDPMTVSFVTQRQTGAGKWKEEFDIQIDIDNTILDFNDLSGGEQVRVAFSLRLALSRLLMRRVGSNIKFLLLDEVDQSLDKRGVKVLADAIHTLSEEFKILIITHNETMKEQFDHIIYVQKGADGSTVSQ